MKIITLFAFILLALCPNAMAEVENNITNDQTINKQKFVNPIFYQPLRPLGRTSTWTYLTPTTIKSMTPLDKNKLAMTGECELVENEQDHIALLCDIFWHNPDEKGKKSIIIYSIKDLYTPKCLRIEESDRLLGEEYPAISSYCVNPPNYNPSESD